MSATGDYRTSVEMVRMELEADGYEIEAVTDQQIEFVGVDPAHLVVSEDLADSDMSDDRLALIERYLAGHNILASGVDDLRQADNKSHSDGSQVTFSGDRGHTDYRSTSLGQKAISMDETGTLRDANNRKASIDVPDVR